MPSSTGLPGTSNNAPPPIPGGYGNPTGAQTNKTPAGGVTAFPQYPLYGPVNTPQTTTPAYNAPTFGSTNMAGVNSGLNLTGDIGNHMLKQLEDTYGKGTGDAIFRIINKGLFNPQAANALLNSLQPGIARGENDILSMFGDAGARFSSGASLGMGDFLSQVNLNEQNTLSQMYTHAQDQQLALLNNTLPTIHDEEVNKNKSGIFGDILGGLEIAGGIASEFLLPGNPLGAGLITGGAGTIAGANGVGSGGGSSSGGVLNANTIQQIINQIRASSASTEAGSGGPTDGSSGGGIGSTGTIPLPTDIMGSMSAGATLGGSDPFGNNGNDGGDNQLMQLLMMLSGGGNTNG